MDFVVAPDIQRRITLIVKKAGLSHIKAERIKCFRSFGSSSRARARIWSFPRIWQLALSLEPNYVIEVISEKFDSLKISDQDKVLIHELLHIPKNFSGALLPHRGRGRRISWEVINELYKKTNIND